MEGFFHDPDRQGHCGVDARAANAVQVVPYLLEQLREGLQDSGFDLLTPFLVSWYNEEEHIVNLPAVHKLPADAGCLAVIVGNSRALWAPFLAWTRARLEADPTWLETHPHALDAFTEEKMQQALAQPGLPAGEVIYAAETLETWERKEFWRAGDRAQ